ncbi:trimethylguanosine synthase isoform X2 [Manduca sexta]|uniref:Trimethylguanosine synthase n=1 Tax=Manduca sexta TaxID=7130 RepID=A0A922CYH0_MANSE|nr:trimethylguanosine synthase isoform X2 [Manduca sexta]KAG6461868.1 hypothetical protein O3G_MSEX012903 [Manduca sexta]
MSEYYDHYHRWEPLAEFHFNIDSENEDEYDEDNFLYCICSRAFIRDTVKTYNAEKEYASESDIEVLQDSQSQEGEDQSHVHFSLDTSYKVKCEKDDVASCYCSASHTENCCSTDEHDAVQIHGTSHALQPSDSGADLTYQDYHSDYTTHDKLERMDQDFQGIIGDEDYLSEETWDKFWAINGERLIWASWIKKYSDYINPAYLNDNNDLIMDENGIPKQHSVDEIYKEAAQKNDEDGMRERKFSYDSKVNPYKKTNVCVHVEKNEKLSGPNKDEQWLPIARRRSCSEHDRILSPRTVAGTDSMTNVTKLTLSSYDVTSSHVTSESTPTDDYSVSSSSDDQSNDQTRIANIDDGLDQVPVEEMDTEQYWQFLWKKHFGEQYALHYANYIHIQSLNKDAINVVKAEFKDKLEEKVFEIECENSEGNSQEMPTVIEVQTQVQQIQLEDKPTKTRKRNKKPSSKYLDSVGVLLQTLLKEEQKKCDEINEVTDVAVAEDVNNKTDTQSVTANDDGAEATSVSQSVSNNNFTSYSYDDGDDDPPEDTPVTLKRSHEIDDEEVASEKIRSTFETMGFCLHTDKMPKGLLVYRKRIGRLRPPRYKKIGGGKKTYFDDDGNAYQVDQTKDSQYEREMQTDEEAAPVKSDTENKSETNCTMNLEPQKEVSSTMDRDSAAETLNTLLPLDSDLLSDAPDGSDRQKSDEYDNTVSQQGTTKRRRRQKRYAKLEEDDHDASDLPPELRDDPKMLKYWKKRHSLFHRFDEGVKLDLESWFSVTPENVARHIATKCGAASATVLDAFCGAGGNTIQFALTCHKVIAVDIDPAKIEMARHNATVYGVADRIEFIVGDFFELAPELKADLVFLSPPWGGPDYTKTREYDIETMLEPRPASELMNVARTISSSIALYLPRNSRSDQILSLAKETGGSVEVEQSFLDKRFVAITAYYY